MAHNSLRRDLAAAIASACPNIAENTAVKGLLERALTALGGPVEDNRPQVETIEQVVYVKAVHGHLERIPSKGAMVTAVPQADGDNTPLVGRDTGDETDAKEAPRVPLFFTTNVIIDDEPRD